MKQARSTNFETGRVRVLGRTNTLKGKRQDLSAYKGLPSCQ